PFTAPSDSPEMKWRWLNRKTRSTGMVTMMVAAMRGAYWMLPDWVNSVRASWTVWLREEEDTTSGHSRSSHTVVNEKIATTAMIGLEIGRKTLQKIRYSLAPS